MAKLLASEYCSEVTQESFRIHGGYGYSKEYEIERLMREAPFLLIGEGTSEIQKTIISRGLLKEYKREVLRHFNGERDLPDFPEHYISDEAAAVITRYLGSAQRAHDAGSPLPEFPEAEVLPFLENTWADTATTIFDNWLGLVYRLTNLDRRVPFMEGVDPLRPLDGLTPE